MGNNLNDRIIYDCVFQGLSVILEEGKDQVLIRNIQNIISQTWHV